jgi:hypothetical protein
MTSGGVVLILMVIFWEKFWETTMDYPVFVLSVFLVTAYSHYRAKEMNDDRLRRILREELQARPSS